MMTLGSYPHGCYAILSLKMAGMMAGRQGIVNQGAGDVFGPSWRPSLSDEEGTTLVIVPVFAILLTVLTPWGVPCPASK